MEASTVGDNVYLVVTVLIIHFRIRTDVSSSISQRCLVIRPTVEVFPPHLLASHNFNEIPEVTDL